MKNNKVQQLYNGLCLTSVFQGVTQNALFEKFFAYCETQHGTSEKRKAYANFVAEIYNHGGSLTALVEKLLFEDENVYVKTVANDQTPADEICQAVEKELAIFAQFSQLTVQDFAQDLDEDAENLPAFASEYTHLVLRYQKRLRDVKKYGYGIFSSQGMFRLSDEKQITPIASADKVSMRDFIGYEQEREQVVANTRAFIEGRHAANVLLCGDAGAGKSSTVKAVANAFFKDGVRLIEIRKDQLSLLPLVMSKIVGNPLKFIIFIDDLSFNRSDDNFSMLKAALEGSASAKADNAVIYATSNRRHIIKESFGDREGDDVHRNDTLQETLSLSERFGLVVLFSKPNKSLYLQIVKELAKKHGIEMEEGELEVQAEAFALRKGNRSARCAEQFIQSLK